MGNIILALIIYFFSNLCLSASTNIPVKSPHISGKHKVHLEYKSVDGFFLQDDKDTNSSSFDILTASKFGLKDPFSWNDVIEYIENKNRKQASRNESYKLFFLARHGEGYHNLAISEYSKELWKCFWQIRNGNNNMTWHDAELTETGINQTTQLSKAWIKQIKQGVPIPQSFYVSPLRRTLQTYRYTWSSLSHIHGKVPIIKEFTRETYGIGTESKRHSKSYITENYPGFTFESGFTENDELWTDYKHESKQHRNYRANIFLNDIFANDSNTIISLTSHSGFIHSILKIIGHRKFSLKTGQMIPVIIKASNPGSYKKPSLTEPWTYYRDECPIDQTFSQQTN